MIYAFIVRMYLKKLSLNDSCNIASTLLSQGHDVSVAKRTLFRDTDVKQSATVASTLPLIKLRQRLASLTAFLSWSTF